MQRCLQVLKLMEALVGFMGSSYGAFLQIILQGGNVRERLFQEGAPAQFVDKFMVRPGISSFCLQDRSSSTLYMRQESYCASLHGRVAWHSVLRTIPES